MHLISTDLPAPLSPASAVTWPAGMSRSMSTRALHGAEVLPDAPEAEQRLVVSSERPLRGCPVAVGHWMPAAVQALATGPRAEVG